MKTRGELLIEARRLEALGRQYAGEQLNTERSVQVGSPTRVLMTFPQTSAGIDSLEVGRTRPWRWIAIAMSEGNPEYRLYQSETASDEPSDRNGSDALPVMSSETAFDVLAEGYGLAEQERIANALAPFTERIGDEEAITATEPAVIEEIEDIVGAEDLTPAERMRTKADIIAFLEGELEPSEFIAAAIERHSRRETQTERVVERKGERMLIDEP